MKHLRTGNEPRAALPILRPPAPALSYAVPKFYVPRIMRIVVNCSSPLGGAAPMPAVSKRTGIHRCVVLDTTVQKLRLLRDELVSLSQ